MVSTGDQRGPALELPRELPRRRARVEPRVLSQDGLLELAQGGAWGDPDLRDQHPMRLAVCVEGLGLPSSPVEREHALGVEALLQGVLGEQRLEAADRLTVAPRGELGVDRELERPQVKLLEAADLGARERL